MKILLVLPFVTYGASYDNNRLRRKGGEGEIPVGLCMLKSFVEQTVHGATVRVYDANIEAIQRVFDSSEPVSMEQHWQHLAHVIENESPDILGCSAFSLACAHNAHQTLALGKQLKPTVFTVMGGAYPTLGPEQALADPSVDAVVLSEGEHTFAALVNAIKNREPLSNIPGVAFRESGAVINNGFPALIDDLDSLPFPDYSDLDIPAYHRVLRSPVERLLPEPKTIFVNTSRGCVFDCGFCSTKQVWGRQRQRSPENVLKELRQHKQNCTFNYLKLNDDLFTHDRQRAIQFCRLLERERLVDKWESCGLTLGSLLHEPLLEAMASSGYHLLSIPVESGNDTILRAIRKPHRRATILRVFEKLRTYNEFYLAPVFILGFPFETWEQIEETLALAAALPSDWTSFNTYTPFPKTKIYDYCLEHGYLEPQAQAYNSMQSSSMLHTPNFDSSQLAERVYAANLSLNFLQNRSLAKGLISRAEIEFRQITDLVPDHAFAWFMRAVTAVRCQKIQEAAECRKIAEGIFCGSAYWAKWREKFQGELATLEEHLPISR